MTDTNTQVAPALTGQEKMLAPSTTHPEYTGFENSEVFAHLQRTGLALCKSPLVPDNFKGEANLPSVLIALEMANRMKASPLAVMQNLYVVHGKPSWSSQWIISCINSSGRYSPLRFDLEQLGKKNVEFEYTRYDGGRKVKEKGTVTINDIRCVAWAIEKETGDRLESPPVTVEMAVKEGWFTKDGSKWQTMPELMIRYRTAAFFGRLYAPELLMGMQSVEEILDITPVKEERSRVPMPTSTDAPEPTVDAPIVETRGEESQETAEPTAGEAPASSTAPSEAHSDQPKVVGNDKLKSAILTAHADDLLQIKTEVGAFSTEFVSFLELTPELQATATKRLMELMKARHKKKG